MNPAGKSCQPWSRLDTLLMLVVVALGVWIAWRFEISLAYHWNWGAIPQYLLRFEEGGGWSANFLLLGLVTTVKLSLYALVLALPLGLAVGLLRVSLHLFNRLVGSVYVSLLRNLPPLVLILVFYFFVSDQILPLFAFGEKMAASPDAVRQLLEALLVPVAHIEAFIAAVITLALFEAAYIAEIVRAGIQSVEPGQWQAASALGMRRWQLLRHVVLPQAFRQMIPPLAGQFISTIKDSSIVAVISIQELTFQGMELMATTYLTFEIWLTVAALYFILTYSCSLMAGRLERRLRFEH